MSRYFPGCPIDGCTDDDMCDECTGAAVCVVAQAVGIPPPKRFREAAMRKVWQLAGENFAPDPARPHPFSTEDMTHEGLGSTGTETRTCPECG